MPSPVFRSQEHWQKQLTAAMIAEGGLSNVAPTGAMMTLIVGIARCFDELGFEASNILDAFAISSAAGTDLDERAAEVLPSGLERLPAQPAGGQVTFGRSFSSASTAILIPAGTSVQDANQHVYTTRQDAILPIGVTTTPGSQTVTVDVVAQAGGADTNVAAGQINQFVSRPAGVDTVTNAAPTSGGSDQESDDAFRDRIFTYVSGLGGGSDDTLISAVLGLSDGSGSTILSASVATDPTVPAKSYLYVDNGSGTIATEPTAITGEVMTALLAGPPQGTAVGGEVFLPFLNRPIDPSQPLTLTSNQRGTLTKNTQFFLDQSGGRIKFVPALEVGEKITANYSYSTGLVALAQKVIDGDAADRTNFPGVRAAGTQVIVAAPSTLFEYVRMSVVSDPSYDRTAVLDEVRGAASELLNSLRVGEALRLAKLIAVCMDVSGVYNVFVTSPATDRTPQQDQLIRFGGVEFV